MKKFYFVLSTFKTKQKKIKFMGISAKFQVANYDELRAIQRFTSNGFKSEVYMLRSLLGFLREGDVAYDVGANIGFYTILMAKKVGVKGKIISFEPDSKNFDVLQKNLKLNDLNNVTVKKIALGDKIGQGSLYIKNNVGIGAISLIGSQVDNFRETTKIIPGDHIILKQNLPLPKAIKIDVEGYEYLTLKGFKKTLLDDFCRVVCCEVHPNLVPSDITKKMY